MFLLSPHNTVFLSNFQVVSNQGCLKQLYIYHPPHLFISMYFPSEQDVETMFCSVQWQVGDNWKMKGDAWRVKIEPVAVFIRVLTVESVQVKGGHWSVPIMHLYFHYQCLMNSSHELLHPKHQTSSQPVFQFPHYPGLLYWLSCQSLFDLFSLGSFLH